uniref:Retrovirus-related Pol polyprotein from transposon TNT 1-94 n=1 Tax=Cajanus cajan TaxID=3821 RepID=A0A151TYJ7_CAJCA|nr:hypothetical protein KK1_004727 [Cajanus cajan]
MISLNGANYYLWKDKMKNLLLVKNLHLYVFASNKPKSKSDEEWDFKHLKECGFIRRFVDNNVYNFIANETCDHLSEFQKNFDQLSRVGIKFDENLLGVFLLISITDSWETFEFP